MDIKCGKILDNVVKEICLEESKLKKHYFLYFNEEKNENKTQIMNKYNNMFKEGNDNNNIINILFPNKEDDFINVLRSNENYVNDIEQLYKKTKILKKFDKHN